MTEYRAQLHTLITTYDAARVHPLSRPWAAQRTHMLTVTGYDPHSMGSGNDVPCDALVEGVNMESLRGWK
jgi:hypothetical protein